MKSKHFNYNNIPWQRVHVELGKVYRVRCWQRATFECQFIKTTRKGFNFLRLDTSKCLIIPKHLYDKNYSGQDIPNRTKKFDVYLPTWIDWIEVV